MSRPRQQRSLQKVSEQGIEEDIIDVYVADYREDSNEIASSLRELLADSRINIFSEQEVFGSQLEENFEQNQLEAVRNELASSSNSVVLSGDNRSDLASNGDYCFHLETQDDLITTSIAIRSLLDGKNTIENYVDETKESGRVGPQSQPSEERIAYLEEIDLENMNLDEIESCQRWPDKIKRDFMLKQAGLNINQPHYVPAKAILPVGEHLETIRDLIESMTGEDALVGINTALDQETKLGSTPLIKPLSPEISDEELRAEVEELNEKIEEQFGGYSERDWLRAFQSHWHLEESVAGVTFVYEFDNNFGKSNFDPRQLKGKLELQKGIWPRSMNQEKEDYFFSFHFNPDEFKTPLSQIKDYISDKRRQAVDGLRSYLKGEGSWEDYKQLETEIEEIKDPMFAYAVMESTKYFTNPETAEKVYQLADCLDSELIAIDACLFAPDTDRGIEVFDYQHENL